MTQNSWYHRIAAAIHEIRTVTVPDHPFILVDDNQLGADQSFAGRQPIPFLNSNGQYWGSPTDDIMAISQMELERENGASSIVFAWTSFWWLDYYANFSNYLKINYDLSIKNENVIIFNLGKRLKTNPDDILSYSKSSPIQQKENTWLVSRSYQTIVDVGANEGQFAAKMRKLFPYSQIHSFEPIPEVYKKLLQNFRDDPNFFGYNFAFGNKSEEAKIFLNEYSPSSSLLKMEDEHKKHFDFAKKETFCDIVIKRMDDVMKIETLQKPVLLKIDVQGFEAEVIKGGRSLIGGCDMIIIEVSFKRLYANQPLFDQIYQLLYALGFKYSGNYEQLISPEDGSILQADAIFLR